MISQTLEYALRAVVTIAQQGGSPITAQEISRLTKVPGPYLSKLLQSLVRANLLKSQRGINGGFSLTKSPEELTILEVVNVVDPIQRFDRCPLNITSHGTNLCPLHRRIDKASAAIEKIFAESTIGEMLAHPSTKTPLCDYQQALMGLRGNLDDFGS